MAEGQLGAAVKREHCAEQSLEGSFYYRTKIRVRSVSGETAKRTGNLNASGAFKKKIIEVEADEKVTAQY